MANSMSRTSRMRLMLVLLVTLVGCDQASKHYAVTHWKGQPRQSYVNDVFRIEYAENEGAFLSMFGTQSPAVRYAILVVGNGIGMVILAVLLLGVSQIDRWSYVAWTLVFVGGVGNLIDRIRIQAVIDFLNLGLGNLRTGIFNVADIAITAGFIMLVPQIFTSPNTESENTVAPPLSSASTTGTSP
jgi:signal peptidase II